MKFFMVLMSVLVLSSCNKSSNTDSEKLNPSGEQQKAPPEPPVPSKTPPPHVGYIL